MSIKDDYKFITKQIEEIRKFRQELEAELDAIEVLAQAERIINDIRN